LALGRCEKSTHCPTQLNAWAATAPADNVNLTAIAENAVAGRNEAYLYTPANRLQEGDGPWGTLAWTYDLVGNRTAEVLNGTATSLFNYPSSSNRLATVTRGSTTLRSFTYDGAGNVVADSRSGAVYNYHHNNRGRLDEFSAGAQLADYTYDGLERLAIRTLQNISPSGTTHYLYDRAGHLLVEASGTGTTNREYVWLGALPLAIFADLDTGSPSLYFVHADHLDRPIRMTDATKAVVWDVAYSPFGAVYSITGSLAANNLRFPGQYFLLESGLHYNWYRHYDPTLGRYLQADVLGFINGSSVFAYAKGNPVSLTDPDGRFAFPWWSGLLRPPIPLYPPLPPYMGPKPFGEDNPDSYDWRVQPDSDWGDMPPYPDPNPDPSGDDGDRCRIVKEYCHKACSYLTLQLDYDFTPWEGQGSRSDSLHYCRNQCHAHFKCPPYNLLASCAVPPTGENLLSSLGLSR